MQQTPLVVVQRVHPHYQWGVSSHNIEGFIESTLDNLGDTKVGLFRADSGFYDKATVALLKAREISHIISAQLTQALQQAIVERCKWQQVEAGRRSRS